MIIRKNQSKIATALLLLTFTISIFALPAANAHTPAWSIPTYAYISVSPNPVGVNQNVFVVMWLDKVLPGATIQPSGQDIRFHDYKLTITKPDNTTETKKFSIVADTTSSQFTLYTPSQVGTYKFKFEFPGQTYTWTNLIIGAFGPPTQNNYTNDTYLASSAETTLTVQQEQITSVEDYPLPTGYWNRPIEGENTNWASIASNWLGSPQIVNLVQPDGNAPDTSHIMWTRTYQDGGVVGSRTSSIPGVTYYTSLSYEGKFSSPIIMQGRLYYPLPLSDSILGGMGATLGGGYACIDLQTGEQIWKQNYAVNPTFGQIYDYESPNQHGSLGYLWAVSGTTWIAYEPETGNWLFNLTNVPSGTAAYTSKGEIVRYVLNVQNKWLALWNNTAAPNLSGDATGISANALMWRPVGKVIDASTAYSWNVSIPALPSGSFSIFGVIENDILLASANFGSGTGGTLGASAIPTVCAISLKPYSLGNILWSQVYTPPPGNLTRMIGRDGSGSFDPKNRVFTIYDKETLQWSGYSIDTGNCVWGPIGDADDYDYFSTYATKCPIIDGRLYVTGFGGVLRCYDTSNGALLWTYGNGGEGNSTNSGLDTPWGNYPMFAGAAADGKIYVFSSEHSPNVPPYKGERIRCIDAYTGEELWTLLGWGESGNFFSANGAIADGYYTYLNSYDMQLYCVGRGPSATTVTATAGVGNAVTIQGTVTDICAGAKKLVQTGKFNVVPAVSDASMGKWMEYLYMQKPMPTNATGVPVTLYISEQSGAVVDTLHSTTDVSGHYVVSWIPITTGAFTVTAVFDGTNGYYASTGVNSIAVGPLSTIATATPTPTATATPTASPTPTPSPSIVPTPPGNPGIGVEVYIAIAAVIIIVAIVTVAVLLRRRK